MILTLLHMNDLFITILCNIFYKEWCTLNVRKTISILTWPATRYQGVRIFIIFQLVLAMLLTSKGQGLCRIDIQLTNMCANNVFCNKFYVTKEYSGIRTQHSSQKNHHTNS